MENGTCEICLVENGEVVASPHLAPLLLKHLEKKVDKDVRACGPCSQLLQLWNDFFDQAKANLDITHPNDKLCQLNIPEYATSLVEKKDNTITVPVQKTLAHEIYCSTFNNDETEAQAVLIGDLGCEYEQCYSVKNEFSNCTDDPLMTLSSCPESELVQDPLQEDVKPNLAFLNTGQLHMPYSCADCKKKFLFARGLYLHKTLQHSKLNRPIEGKNEKLVKNSTNDKQIESLEKQIAISVKEEERQHKSTLVCPKCNITLSSKQFLISHLLKVCIEKINGFFTCMYCIEKFNSMLGLNFHIRKHLNDSDFSKCNHCEKKFASSEILAHHMQVAHSINLKQNNGNKFKIMQNNSRPHKTNSRFSCSLCFRTFSRQCDLQKHITTVHSSKLTGSVGNRFKCTFCMKMYQSKGSLAKHIKVHKNFSFNNNNNKQQNYLLQNSSECVMHSCEICNARFSTDCDLKSHSCVHIDNNLSSCDASNYEKNKIDLNTNLKLKTNVKVPLSPTLRNTCKLCLSVFKTFGGLRVHTKKFHANRNADNLKLKFQCNYCNNRFRTKSGLKRHIFVHKKGEMNNPSMPETFQCNICSQRFDNLAALANHKSNHIKCNKNVSNNMKYNVLRKKLINKQPVSQNPKHWACNVCSLSFKRKQYLKLHLKKFHLRNAAELKFKCTHCGNRFINQSGLSSHILWQHTDHQLATKINTNKSASEEFPCDFCHETLASQKFLDLHMQNEHLIKKSTEVVNSKNDTPNAIIIEVTCKICKVCNKTFKTQSELQNHELTHTNLKCAHYSCTYCKKKFLNKAAQQSHIRHIHSNKSLLKNKPGIEVNANKIKTPTEQTMINLLQFQCKYCLIKLNNKTNLHCHMKKCHLSENKNTFLCKTCYQNFPSSILLSLHMCQHQQKVKIENAISTIGASSLKLLKLNTVVNTENLTCSLCCKHFSSQSSLKNHLRKIHGQTNIPCKYCCVMFISKTRLTEHIMKTHLQNSRTGNPTFKQNIDKLDKINISNAIACKYCNQSINKNDLATHLKRLHSAEPVKQGDTKFKNVSEKNYTVRDSLYFCNFCMRSETSIIKIANHIEEEHLG